MKKNGKEQATWGGRFSCGPSELMLHFGESVSFDKILARFDVQGSIAHARMLCKIGILGKSEFSQIERGLKKILKKIESGDFKWSESLEDVHMNIEQALTSEVPALQINPYLYQFNTPVEYEAASISRAVLAVKSSPTVIMLNTPEATTDNCLQLKDSFKSKNIKVKEITVTTENKDSLVNYFQTNGNYLVFFNNDRYKNISQYIDVLNRVNNMNIELIGGYNWLGHKEEIHLPFYYASLFVPDSKRWKQKEYTRSFDHYFGHPLSTGFPRYDMLGYDITSMVLNGLNQYGPGGLQQEMPNYRYNGVQSSIQFVRKNPMGGCTNSVLTVLRYANGRTTEIEVK